MTLRRVSFIAVFLALAAFLAAPIDAQAQEQQGQESFGSLISAINNTDAQVQSLENANVQDVQTVNIEDIRENLNENQVQTLDEALRDADRDALRNAVQNNENLANSLNQEDIDASNVVAIDASNDGTVVVYHEPTAFEPEGR